MRVKCLAQEHNTISGPARARTRSALSGVERTNHEATAPPPYVVVKLYISKLHLVFLLYGIFYLI